MSGGEPLTEQREEGCWGLALVRGVTNLVCICRGDRITWVNEAGAAMLGADGPASLIGHAFSEYVDPDYGELMALGLETFAEEEGGVPLKLTPPDGRPIDVHLTVTALDFDDGGEPAFMVECRDITEYIRAAREAGEREKRLRRILDTVADGIITVANDGTIETFNPAAERIFGFRAMEVRGRNVRTLIPDHAHDDGELTAYIDGHGADFLGKVKEMEGQRKDGTIFPMELTASELQAEQGRILTGVVRDITARKKAEEEIKRLAHHDALTGLPNRNLFNDRLNRALDRARRQEKLVGLMFVDLDKFKPINDQLGHDAGDYVLRGVADRLKSQVRATDTIARVGGDEFVVILESLENWEAAGGVARKLIDSLAQPFDWRGRQCTVGASIGISVYPRDGDSAERLIGAADDAMYRVKEAGRNNFLFFNG